MSKLFKCGVCGYTHEGDVAPEVCPKCGSPKEKFAELSEEAKQLVLRSRQTNLYHMQALAHLAQVEQVALKGIDDNLDPGCLKVFQDTVAATRVLEAKIKAEIAGHVGKGKWG